MSNLAFTLLLILCLAQTCIIVYQQAQAERERKDLYNRIMAGTLNDYTRETKDKPPPKINNPLRANIEKHVSMIRENIVSGE